MLKNETQRGYKIKRYTISCTIQTETLLRGVNGAILINLSKALGKVDMERYRQYYSGDVRISHPSGW